MKLIKILTLVGLFGFVLVAGLMIIFDFEEEIVKLQNKAYDHGHMDGYFESAEFYKKW